MPKQYKCQACHGTFDMVRDDDEAKQESAEMFGNFPSEDLAIVCDDCWVKMGFGTAAE